MIDVQDVIRGLRQKAAQLAQAVLVLEELDGAGAAHATPAATTTTTSKAVTLTATASPVKLKRKVSASTRARMKAAQQARWKRVNAERLKRNLKLVKKA